MTTESVSFSGPLGLFRDDKENLVFDHPVADRHGLYVWTVPTKHGELVYYVGETGVSFKERFAQHLSAQLGGLYRVYKPEALVEGRLDYEWPGLYGPGKAEDLTGYLDRIEEMSALNRRYLQLVRVYLAAGDWDRHLRRSLEHALAKWIRDNQPPEASNFYEEGVRYAGGTLADGVVVEVSGGDEIRWPESRHPVRRV